MSDLGRPESYLTLEPGTAVHGADGGEVGTVEHVLALEDEDIFEGLVLSTDEGRRFADATLVEEIREGAVVLTVAAADVPRLPEPSENPAAVDSTPDDTTPDGLSDKLRRAWDLVSGRY